MSLLLFSPIFSLSAATTTEVDEEFRNQLKQAIESGQAAEIEEELGDMFFTLVNLSRHFSVDAETSLRLSANKFEQRYRQMETLIQQDGLKVSELDQDVLERYWQQVKQS